jgi:hypothetical protein
MPFAESTMWKDIERYFLNARTLVWINPRTIRRLVGLIPDVVISPKPWLYDDKIEMTVVEVKRTINQRNFSTALGQCVRFRRFATKIYLAAHEPLPQTVIDELSIVAREIGALSINDVGGVSVVREPTPIEQTNREWVRSIYSALYLETTRWGTSVGHRGSRMFRCLYCFKLFRVGREKCPHCDSSVKEMLEVVNHANDTGPLFPSRVI